MAAAAKVPRQSQDHVDSSRGESDPEDIERAQSNVVITKDALKKAKEDYDRMSSITSIQIIQNVGRAYLQIKVSNAQDAYDHAVTVLTNLLGNANELDLAVAEADAKASRSTAWQTPNVSWTRYKTALTLMPGPGTGAPVGGASRAGSCQAVDRASEQLAVAQSQVDVARAAAGVIEVQMKKLVCVAPRTVSCSPARSKPGEVVVPGRL